MADRQHHYATRSNGHTHVEETEALNPQLAQVFNQLEQLIQAVNNNICNPNNNVRVEREPDWAKKIAQRKPNYFYGKEDPALLENWIRDFDKIFHTMECPEVVKINEATFFFKEKADNWWTANRTRLMAQEGFDWEAMKVAMRDNFYPKHVKEQKYQEFIALVQHNDSVTDYYDKFVDLARFAQDTVPTEDRLVDRFIAGLKLEIQSTMLTRDYDTLSEAYRRAANIGRVNHTLTQQLGKRKVEYQGSGGYAQGINSDPGVYKHFKEDEGTRNYHHQHRKDEIQYNKATRPTRHYHCKRCNIDHPGANCDGSKVLCNYCGILGHRKFECDKRKAVEQRRNNNGGNNYKGDTQTFQGNRQIENAVVGHQGNDMTPSGQIFRMNLGRGKLPLHNPHAFQLSLENH